MERDCLARNGFPFDPSIRAGAHALRRGLPTPSPCVSISPEIPSAAQCGAVAQLGERSVRNAEVEGSIPFGSTSLHFETGRFSK